MKRLVTQFDKKRTRATVATPTCCCCCCCVASIVTATAVPVLNSNDLAARAGVLESRRWLYWMEALLALPLVFLVPFLVVPLLRRVVPVGGGPRRH